MNTLCGIDVRETCRAVSHVIATLDRSVSTNNVVGVNVPGFARLVSLWFLVRLGCL